MQHHSSAAVLLPRRADPARDNDALCALARRCPQGKRVRFYHDRADYYERGRWHESCEVLVLERQGVLAAAGSVAPKRVWLGGAWQSAAYLFDLIVDPAYRRQGLARQLFRALLQVRQETEAPPQLFYSYLLADNDASRRLYESEGFTAFPRLLRYHILLPRRVRREPPPGFHLSEPVRLTATTALDPILQAQYDFVDRTAGHEGLFQLDWRGTRCWAVLRRGGKEVLVDVPWYYDLLGRLMPFIPRRGRVIRAWSLHFLAADGPEPRSALHRLLESIAWVAAQEGIDALLLPLFADDPRTADVRGLTLTRWGLAPGKVCLYVGGKQAEAVLRSPRPLLMSARDG